MPAIRIGNPDSPILPGTPVPGKPGKYYEAGQFAPSVDELATSTFVEANKAGLLANDLPIFDDKGAVSEELVHSWNPKESLPGTIISGQVDKFSLASIVSTHRLYPSLLEGVGISSIQNGDSLEAQGTKAIAGQALITAVTQARNRNFTATLYIYSRFYQFISTPIVAEIPGRTKGVSVSMFATLKAIGHVLFNKMAHEGQMKLIGNYLEAAGWSKTPDGGTRGSFMGKKNMSSFYHEGKVTSEVARYSPVDDFADTFAHFLTHRSYLAAVAPEKLAVLDEIIDHYGLV